VTEFVAGIETLYGEQFVSYNVHILTHLPDAVVNWGPLWANSAFVFEGVLLRFCHCAKFSHFNQGYEHVRVFV